MNILFWNVYKKNNYAVLNTLLMKEQIDIIFLSEAQLNGMDKLLENNSNYRYEPGYGGCAKIITILNSNIEVTILKEEHRFLIYLVTNVVLKEKYIVCALHLPSNPNSNSTNRLEHGMEIASYLSKYEKQYNAESIIIGDFNCNPFDTEMLYKSSFNAVVYKTVINESEWVTYNHKRYRRFYNPMFNWISEENMRFGSYYYPSGANPLYWNVYDQVLVRKQLINKIRRLELITKIGDNSLLTAHGIINKTYSDHLPLLVEV